MWFAARELVQSGGVFVAYAQGAGAPLEEEGNTPGDQGKSEGTRLHADEGGLHSSSSISRMALEARGLERSIGQNCMPRAAISLR